MNEVNVSVLDLHAPRWLSKVPRFCQKVLQEIAVDEREVSVLLCSDSLIRDLNLRYRDCEAPTDVLSFLQQDGSPVPDNRPLGDVVISLESAKRNARKFAVTYQEELKRLLVHGLLHLKGMDHEASQDPAAMLGLQDDIMSKLTEEKLF